MGGAPSRPKLQGGKNLVLVGIPGQGKSCTGNSILGKLAFYSADCTMPITLNTGAAIEHVDGHRMIVVDTPGVLDVRDENKVKQAERVIDSLDECFKVCEEGFDWVLLVIKYGNRFQGEQVELVTILKNAFGENIFKEHGIVIVTNGEAFDSDYKGTDLTFQKWCEGQQGDIDTLLKECDGRLVLFYNKTVRRRVECVGKLFSLLNEKMNTRYTKDMYDEHAGERKKYLLKVDIDEYTRTVRDRIKHINEQLQKKQNNEGPVNHQNLMKDAWHLEWEINQRDDGTNFYQDLKERVRELLEDIESHQDK